MPGLGRQLRLGGEAFACSLMVKASQTTVHIWRHRSGLWITPASDWWVRLGQSPWCQSWMGLTLSWSLCLCWGTFSALHVPFATTSHSNSNPKPGGVACVWKALCVSHPHGSPTPAGLKRQVREAESKRQDQQINIHQGCKTQVVPCNSSGHSVWKERKGLCNWPERMPLPRPLIGSVRSSDRYQGPRGCGLEPPWTILWSQSTSKLWANSGREWGTGKPWTLQSLGS